MMQKRTRNTVFETRAENGVKHITGYFVVFDDTYEIVEGVTESIDRHALDNSPNTDIRRLVNHDTTLVLGRTSVGTLTLKRDDHGLWGDIIMNEDDQDAMNLYARVQRGDVSQCSFGFEILEERADVRDDGSVHYTILAVNLFEVSCVTFPAYESTEIQARKNDAEAVKKRRHEAWKLQVVTRLKGEQKNA